MKNRFGLYDVTVTDPLWIEAAEKNRKFLSEMDPERVLSGFRKTAGIKTASKPYGGWEDSLIAGHAVGHYFSALAMLIASLRGEKNRKTELCNSVTKAKTIVNGLLECQKKTGSGFLSAATVQDKKNPEIQFDVLEGKAEGQQWVPWYALHKVLQGLIDLWKYADIDGAEKAACNLADWVCSRALSWDQQMRRQVLSVEYGGMNDSLYQLYCRTEKEEYLKAAEVFDEPELYSDLLSFKNRMRGVHANATIPKILGYLIGVQALEIAGRSGETKKRIEVAEKFWDTVMKNQTYATGGIGDMEHFFADGLLDGSRTQCNAESCCCYNMLKLSQVLFQMTGKTKYPDYIEKTLWNAKLGSVGPSGGYTYFNPMATGYYRLYSSSHPKSNPFWCCVGTGLEDFSKFPDQIYYCEGKDIYVTQWISSDLRIGETVIRLRVDFEKGHFSLSRSKDGANIKMRFQIRIPKWIRKRSSLLPKDKEYLEVVLSDGGMYAMDFEMKLLLLTLPDNASVKGFQYGPFVLSVPLGKEKWGISAGAGIDVFAPAWKVVFGSAVLSDITYGKTQKAILDREFLTLPEDESEEDFEKRFKKHIRREKDGFVLTGLFGPDGKPLDLPLLPYYKMGDQRYGIYWYIGKQENVFRPGKL